MGVACSRCHRPFTAKDLAAKAGVSQRTAQMFLRGDLLASDIAGDRRDQALEKLYDAIDELSR